jgi:hypothetical protein
VTAPQLAILRDAQAPLAAWQMACIAMLREEGAAPVAVLDAGPSPAARESWPRRRYAAWVRRGCAALRPVSAALGLPVLPAAATAPDIDVVLAFAPMPAGVPAPAGGVWTVMAGAEALLGEALPGGREIAGGAGAIELRVVATGGAAAPRTLHRIALPVLRSHARTLEAVLAAVPGLLRGALRQVPPPGSRLGIYVNLTNLISASGASDGGAPLVCGNVVRVSQTQIQCMLPEGAGAFLAAKVVVANVAGGSIVDGAFAAVAAYSAPVISQAYVLPNSTVIDPMDISATVAEATGVASVTSHPRGAPAAQRSSNWSKPGIDRAAMVRMGPAAIRLTRMPSGPRSRAKYLESDSREALATPIQS